MEKRIVKNLQKLRKISCEGQNINPEMYIGKKHGEELVCVIKDGPRVHIMERCRYDK